MQSAARRERDVASDEADDRGQRSNFRTLWVGGVHHEADSLAVE